MERLGEYVLDSLECMLEIEGESQSRTGVRYMFSGMTYITIPSFFDTEVAGRLFYLSILFPLINQPSPHFRRKFLKLVFETLFIVLAVCASSM
jgi:hypothetical protein